MYNNRQIAKKKMEISYRDELFRRDQIRQAHYRKLAEEKAKREGQEIDEDQLTGVPIPDVLETEPVSEVTVVKGIPVTESETEIVELELEPELKPELELEPELKPEPIPDSIVKPKRTITRKYKGKRKPDRRKVAESVELKESDTESLFFTALRKKGWYDVIGPDGPVTTNAMRLEPAEKKAERMNNGLSR